MPRTLRATCALALFFSFGICAQPNPDVTARIVVTLGHYYGRSAPVLTAQDIAITERFDPLPIVSLTPFKGDRAALELYLLIDNCSNCDGGPNAGELNAFIKSQPATTSIGVAYIQNGQLKIAQTPVAARDRVVSALAPPAGGQPSNPFGPLKALIEGWKPTTPRRAIVMITNGVDPAREERDQNPAAEAAIAAAQRAAVTVFALYHPSADYLNADFDKIYTGQIQIAHVARESGGEGYFIGYGPLPSLGPFLEDVADHLANQYLLEFTAPASSSPGELRDVEVKSGNKDIDIMAPDRVWIAGRTGTR